MCKLYRRFTSVKFDVVLTVFTINLLSVPYCIVILYSRQHISQCKFKSMLLYIRAVQSRKPLLTVHTQMWTQVNRLALTIAGTPAGQDGRVLNRSIANWAEVVKVLKGRLQKGIGNNYGCNFFWYHLKDHRKYIITYFI